MIIDNPWSIHFRIKGFSEDEFTFRDHPFSTYAKFSEKLTFLTP